MARRAEAKRRRHDDSVGVFCRIHVHGNGSWRGCNEGVPVVFRVLQAGVAEVEGRPPEVVPLHTISDRRYWTGRRQALADGAFSPTAFGLYPTSLPRIRISGEQPVHPFRYLIEVVHPRVLRGNTRGQRARVLLERHVGFGIISVKNAVQRGLRGHGGLQEGVRHLECVDTACK